MTCEELDDLRVDLDRDEATDPTVGELVRTHAAGCVRCASRLAEARSLTAGLRELAEATETVPAPTAAHAAVLARFRERRPIASSRRVPMRWGLAAAAAVLLAAVLLVLTRPGLPPLEVPAPDVAERSDAGFVPLGLGAPPTESESFLVVRVQMSSSSLASLGLPIEPSSSELVRADLLLGEDGVARAIRLVD